MSSADEKLERAAETLERLSRRAARAGGVKAKLAEPLADDAEFLRKLKPSLIAARLRGEAATDAEPTRAVLPAAAVAADQNPRPRTRSSGRSNLLVVVAAMLVAGMLLARVVDWLGARYPRG